MSQCSRNSPSITAVLPLRVVDILDAYADIGVSEPSLDQISELAQHLRDVAGNAAKEALGQWKRRQ